ncbi:MAG TPA: SdpI family protein [Candidatus Paceibacterota bacterium]|nr:SdpI family protein [Candidatus Paceibacterota bacterium]
MRKSEWVMLLIVAAAAVTAWVFYPQLPPLVAVHWDSHGVVNGYFARESGVAIFPIVIAALFIIFFIIPRIDPRRENIRKFRRYYNYLVIAIALFFYYLFGLFLAWNLGLQFDMLEVLVPAFAVLFWVIGAVLPHTQPNWFIGIRTPWTISSADVWRKTHELGGILFRASAVMSLFGIFVPPSALPLMLISVVLSSIVLVVYSYFIYEKERKTA